MKIGLALLLLVTVIVYAFQEGEKTIPVNDLRKTEIAPWDTSTAGHQLGDLIVNRVLHVGDGINSPKDTSEIYDIHFFKIYENRLRNYTFGFGVKGDYDNAMYKWLTDSIVSVTLVNSTNNKRSKNIHIVQAERQQDLTLNF